MKTLLRNTRAPSVPPHNPACFPAAMDSVELASRRDRDRELDLDFRDHNRLTGDIQHLSPTVPRHPALGAPADRQDAMAGYTLMVAGRRTGKTSFLRLLLDTTLVSPSATHDQLQSVAKFVQGCSGFTSHIRTVSVNVELAVGDNDPLQPLNLTLIDTPALDYHDDAAAQRTVNEILRHVDARFSESVEDVSTVQAYRQASPLMEPLIPIL